MLLKMLTIYLKLLDYSKENIYQSVPTGDTEINQIMCAISEKIGNFNHIDCTITPILISPYIMKLKSDKSDGDLGFYSRERHGMCVHVS